MALALSWSLPQWADTLIDCGSSVPFGSSTLRFRFACVHLPNYPTALPWTNYLTRQFLSKPFECIVSSQDSWEGLLFCILCS